MECVIYLSAKQNKQQRVLCVCVYVRVRSVAREHNLHEQPNLVKFAFVCFFFLYFF